MACSKWSSRMIRYKGMQVRPSWPNLVDAHSVKLPALKLITYMQSCKANQWIYVISCG